MDEDEFVFEEEPDDEAVGEWYDEVSFLCAFGVTVFGLRFAVVFEETGGRRCTVPVGLCQ
jgi:hypothetical protein